MSASRRPTRRPSMCRARARLVATVDLPTPPLPLATARTLFTPGMAIFWAAAPAPGGCMIILPMIWRRLFLDALRALAQLAQMLQREQARVVAITPDDFVGIIADRTDRHRLE